MLILMNSLVGNSFINVLKGQNDDVKNKLGSIILMSCSDNYINNQLIEIDVAFDFVTNWFTWPMLLLIFNLYIDYCGLELSYGGTWNMMLRKARRCCRSTNNSKKDRVNQEEPLINETENQKQISSLAIN